MLNCLILQQWLLLFLLLVLQAIKSLSLLLHGHNNFHLSHFPISDTLIMLDSLISFKCPVASVISCRKQMKTIINLININTFFLLTLIIIKYSQVYYDFQASGTGIVVSWFFGAKSDLDMAPAPLGSVLTHSSRSVRLIALQHISRSRCAAELARCRCFGQMVFSGDILLRWGSQIMSICLDTVWADSAAPATCRFNTTGQVCKDGGAEKA